MEIQLKSVTTVLIQFYHTEKAYAVLKGPEQAGALAGTVAVILAVGWIPLLITGNTGGAVSSLPFLILMERAILAGAGGVALYALSYALGYRKSLWHAVSSCILSMGAFMIMIALLTLLSDLFSLRSDFTWSIAEFFSGIPESRLSVFLILFLARLDLASVVTVFLWGKGISSVWELKGNTGTRMAWTVYLFGLLMITLPVFLSASGSEGMQ